MRFGRAEPRQTGGTVVKCFRRSYRVAFATLSRLVPLGFSFAFGVQSLVTTEPFFFSHRKFSPARRFRQPDLPGQLYPQFGVLRFQPAILQFQPHPLVLTDAQTGVE